MAPVRLGINDIPNISPDRGIFCDTNFLIFQFADTSPEHKNLYSSIFLKLMVRMNPLFTDIIVVSEFINRLFVKEAVKRKILPEQRKAFRDTKEGQQTMEKIYSQTKSIFEYPHIKLTNQGWNKKDIVNLLTVDRCDFNDKLIIEICRNNNLLLLTHDSDFASAPIDILTANKQLLKAL